MIFKEIRTYLMVAALGLLVAQGFYASFLRNRLASQAETISRLEGEKRGLEAGIAALEAVNVTRTATIKNLEDIKRNIQDAPEAPLPSPIASALMGLREQQLRASRTGQPDGLPAKPSGPR